MSGVALLFAPFKALALSIAAIILALTPMSTLTFWVESGSETIYSSPGYTVVYKPNILSKITRSNETRVKIEVYDERGRPISFAALLSGPTKDNVIEVAHVSGKGGATASIGKYVAEVRKTLKQANSDPERSGLGMLILISTIIEENGEHYAAADMVSASIIPGKAIGKDIVVSVKFKPVIKHKIGGGGGSEAQPQDPPRTITHYCVYGSNYENCYLWKLDEVLYVTQLRYVGEQVIGWDYIPVAITILDNNIGSKASQIVHYYEITLNRTDVAFVRFTLSLGWNTGRGISVYVPGPGYEYYIKRDLRTETIYKVLCDIKSTLSSEDSKCTYLWNDNSAPPLPVSKFTGDVIASTGFYGMMWSVKYKYVSVDWLGRESIIQDNVVAVWIEPRFNEYGKIVMGVEVDDNPNDGIGITERTLRELGQNITYKSLKEPLSGLYTLLFEKIFSDSGASPHFGIAIAAGALISWIIKAKYPLLALILRLLGIGVEFGMHSEKAYKHLGYFYLALGSYDRITGSYGLYVRTFRIKAELVDRTVPLFVFRPTLS